MTVEAKALIERAARSVGLSASDFTVAAACRAARETLHRHEMTRLSVSDTEAFIRAFEATEPTAALVDLMRLQKDAARQS